MTSKSTIGGIVIGYEVIVTGRIRFKDLEGFKREFEKELKKSGFGLDDDFTYFFTKMWGEK